MLQRPPVVACALMRTILGVSNGTPTVLVWHVRRSSRAKPLVTRKRLTTHCIRVTRTALHKKRPPRQAGAPSANCPVRPALP